MPFNATAGIVFLLVAIHLRNIHSLSCNAGLRVERDGHITTDTIHAINCPQKHGQVCQDIEATVNQGGVELKMYSGGCSHGCKENQCSRTFYKNQLRIFDRSSSMQDITVCNVFCCTSSDYCNIQPAIPKVSPSAGNSRKCYKGSILRNQHGVVLNNTTKPITCSTVEADVVEEMSCFRANVDVDKGNGDIDSVSITECVPKEYCEKVKCDWFLEDLQQNVNSQVVRCDTKCCNEDFCNNATATKFSKIILLPIFTFLLSIQIHCEILY